MTGVPFSFLEWPNGTGEKWPAERMLRLVGITEDRSALLVRDAQEQRRAIRLRLPSLFDLSYPKSGKIPIDSTPVSLSRTVLHLPPCRKDLESARAVHTDNEVAYREHLGLRDWETYAPIVMHLDNTAEEDCELLRGLADWKRLLGGCERGAKLEQPKGLPAEESEQRRQQFGNGIRVSVDPADVTLADLKAGIGGIRNQYLIKQFTRLYGFQPKSIRCDAHKFRRWLRGIAVNMKVRTVNRGTLDFALRLSENEWEILEAAVRYELRFANSSKIWLDSVEEASVLTIAELYDFDRHEGIPASQVASSLGTAIVKQAKAIQAGFERHFDKIQEFFPNTPAAKSARKRILARGVQVEFLDWVLKEYLSTGKRPTGKRALSECRAQGWGGRRRGVSKASVSRWMKTIWDERAKARLDAPKGEDAMRHKVRDSNIEDIEDTSLTRPDCPADEVEGEEDDSPRDR